MSCRNHDHHLHRAYATGHKGISCASVAWRDRMNVTDQLIGGILPRLGVTSACSFANESPGFSTGAFGLPNPFPNLNYRQASSSFSMPSYAPLNCAIRESSSPPAAMADCSCRLTELS